MIVGKHPKDAGRATVELARASEMDWLCRCGHAGYVHTLAERNCTAPLCRCKHGAPLAKPGVP